MRRCSFAWDSHKSALIEIDSSDSDDDVSILRRRPARKSANSEHTTRRNRFRISSEESSASDVIIDSDEEVKNAATPRKLVGLILPRFSYDTPDKTTALKTDKLLRDISNICGTPFKSKTKLSDLTVSSVENAKTDTGNTGAKSTNRRSKGSSGKRSLEEKKIDNDRLFDQLIGRNSPNNDEVSIDATEAKADLRKPPNAPALPIAPTPLENSMFKVPKNNVFKKQREVSNRIKNPADSKILFKRSDDSDSSNTCSSRENLDKLCRLPEVDDLFVTKETPQIEVKSDEDVDFYTKPRSPPVRRKRGKAKEFTFSDWKDVLDEIGGCNKKDRELGFIGSLDDTINGYSRHPKATFFKDKFAKEKENLTKLLFRIFNDKVFDGQLPEDMEIEWSGRLTTSAGITHLSRKYVNREYQHLSSITLSKVQILPKESLDLSMSMLYYC
ncbi:unnamed protein product [Nesidiocoris tenuis]|uniref:SprT-like domain-containing protein n=1 Tax=Nesidiocoris tenuis TaxID=355587 RepID=A0A6H5HDW2_9HEMI|nr:unnamed protein product [Nesidiocoris tenuis]